MLMMKQQNMFGCNNSTEINQIVLDHGNPSNSKDQLEHEEIINTYLHFPHPFLDDDDLFLSHFLSQQQHQQQQQILFSGGGDCWKEQEEEEKQELDQEKKKKKKKCGGSSSNRKKGSSCTKRRGKKDRHSKICTAQGPRDRRMRLSLQIARKFFDLQDMLGFDKASKTIEWLLLNSNSAIKDLKQSYFLNNNNSSGVSHGSVCSGSSEVVSEIIRDNNIGAGVATVAAAAKQDQEQEEGAAFMATFKDKKSRPLRTVARESRDRARARARQRTMLKNTPHPPPSIISISQDFDLLSSDFPSIHTFFSGNNNNNSTHFDYPTLSCPNSTFLPSPLPLPYSLSDSTLLKLP